MRPVKTLREEGGKNLSSNEQGCLLNVRFLAALGVLATRVIRSNQDAMAPMWKSLAAVISR
jgi:hypothetical protein